MYSGPHSASSAQLFLFPAVFSQQPLCVCVAGGRQGMGQPEEWEGLKEPTGQWGWQGSRGAPQRAGCPLPPAGLPALCWEA